MMPNETHWQKVTLSISTRPKTASGGLVVWTSAMTDRTDSARRAGLQESTNLIHEIPPW